MKKKFALTLFGIAFVFSGTLFAQTTESPLPAIAENVKILPSATKGVIRVLYAQESSSPVEIVFYNNEGELGSDKVHSNTYDKGFLKGYDISNISSDDFRIIVSTETSSVTYHMVLSKDRKTFEPVLEKVSYNEVITASKKASRKN